MPVGEEITVVEATDADTGINSQISYSIEDNGALSVIEINAETGRITLSQPLGQLQC